MKTTEYLLNNMQDFSVETTLSSQQPINLLKKAKAQGYYIEIIYMIIENISASKDRIDARVKKGGHDIPNEAINRRYNRSFNNFIKAASYADKITIYDNSEYIRKKIISIENKQVFIHHKIPFYLEPTLVKLEQIIKK
ncbi:MAG: zeta toxin family protein [Alphaproteobacteria bacterium]